MRKPSEQAAMPATGHPEEIVETIHSVMHLFRARQYRVLRDGPYGLTHMESKVLAFFADHPGATLTDLVAKSGRDKAQLTRLIKALRDKEFLEARVDEHDRRSTRLALSAAGEKARRAVQAQGARLADVAVAGLNREERVQLASLLARMHANLDGEAD